MKNVMAGVSGMEVSHVRSNDLAGDFSFHIKVLEFEGKTFRERIM